MRGLVFFALIALAGCNFINELGGGVCGDGDVDNSEECDDGGASGECSSTCELQCVAEVEWSFLGIDGCPVGFPTVDVTLRVGDSPSGNTRTHDCALQSARLVTDNSLRFSTLSVTVAVSDEGSGFAPASHEFQNMIGTQLIKVVLMAP